MSGALGVYRKGLTIHVEPFRLVSSVCIEYTMLLVCTGG